MARSRLHMDPETGLTPQQETFATALARGLSQADAWRLAHPDSRASDKTVWEKACKMAADAKVKARVQELLTEAKIADIDSVGRAWCDLLAALDKAEANRNWTAYASLMRQRLQGLGALAPRIELNTLSHMDDTTLIERLAKGDPVKRQVLRAMIGAETFEDCADSDAAVRH